MLRLGPSEAAALAPLPAPMRRGFTRSKGALVIPTHDAVITEILTRVDSSELRRKVNSFPFTARHNRENNITLICHQYKIELQRLVAFILLAWQFVA